MPRREKRLQVGYFQREARLERRPLLRMQIRGTPPVIFLRQFVFFLINPPQRAELLRGTNYGLVPAGGTEHRNDFGGLRIPNPMLGFRTSARISQRLGDSNLRRTESFDPESHALTI